MLAATLAARRLVRAHGRPGVRAVASIGPSGRRNPKAFLPPRKGVFDDSIFETQAPPRWEPEHGGDRGEAPVAAAGEGRAETEAAAGDAAGEVPGMYDGSEAVDAELWRKTARERDRDGALAAAFLPPAAAEAMFVLRCLNSEVARVLDATRGNGGAAALRFQFWHDLVTRAGAGRGHPHPISVPLSIVMARFGLTERYLHRLIDARAQDAAMRSGDGPDGGGGGSAHRPQTLEDVEEYADATEGSLALLALETLGAGGSAEAEAAAGYVARATVMSNLIRGMRVHASMGQIYVPAELTDAHDVSPSSLLRVFRLASKQAEVSARAEELGGRDRGGAGPPTGNRTVGPSDEAALAHDRVVACAYDFAVAANDNLRAARELRADVDPVALPALLTAVPTGVWLRHFEGIGFDPCSPKLVPRGHLGVTARLWLSRLRGTY